MNDEAVEKKTGGARNILILGVASVVIALTTSLVSLYVYHKSGDIYLDCSLPDADCPSARSDSEENNRSQVYVFQDSGDIDEKVLEEYLKEIETPINRVKKLEDPFGGNALSLREILIQLRSGSIINTYLIDQCS